LMNYFQHITDFWSKWTISSDSEGSVYFSFNPIFIPILPQKYEFSLPTKYYPNPKFLGDSLKTFLRGLMPDCTVILNSHSTTSKPPMTEKEANKVISTVEMGWHKKCECKELSDCPKWEGGDTRSGEVHDVADCVKDKFDSNKCGICRYKNTGTCHKKHCDLFRHGADCKPEEYCDGDPSVSYCGKCKCKKTYCDLSLYLPKVWRKYYHPDCKSGEYCDGDRKLSHCGRCTGRRRMTEDVDDNLSYGGDQFGIDGSDDVEANEYEYLEKLLLLIQEREKREIAMIKEEEKAAFDELLIVGPTCVVLFIVSAMLLCRIVPIYI